MFPAGRSRSGALLASLVFISPHTFATRSGSFGCFNSIVRAGKFEPNNVIEQRVFDLIVRMKLARHNRLSIAEGPR